MDGVTIFPKLPAYLRMYETEFTRNSAAREAAKKAAEGAKILMNINKITMPKPIALSKVPPGAAAEDAAASGGSGRASGERGGGRRAEAEEEEGGSAARSAGLEAETEVIEVAGGVGAATEGGGADGDLQPQQKRQAVQQYTPMPRSNVLPSHNAPRVVAGIRMELDLSTDVKGSSTRGKDKKVRAPRRCLRCVKYGGAAPAQCIGASTSKKSKKKDGEMCDYFHACGRAKGGEIP